MTDLSALRLPREHRLYPAAVPLAGLLDCTPLALSLPGQVLLAVFAAVAVGLLYYALQTSVMLQPETSQSETSLDNLSLRR